MPAQREIARLVPLRAPAHPFPRNVHNRGCARRGRQHKPTPPPVCEREHRLSTAFGGPSPGRADGRGPTRSKWQPRGADDAGLLRTRSTWSMACCWSTLFPKPQDLRLVGHIAEMAGDQDARRRICAQRRRRTRARHARLPPARSASLHAAGWSTWAGIVISARPADVRAAQQLGVLASLAPFVIVALMSFNVIVPTIGLALGLAGALLIVDSRGWRAVAAIFDRERSDLPGTS
jgi:hypothetical protein